MARYEPKKNKARLLESAPDAIVAGTARIVAGNTLEYELSTGARAVQLHDTVIVIIGKDGTLTLNSGGFRTNTTKERINRYLPDGLHLWQDKSIWYIGGTRWKKDPITQIFYDGIMIHGDEIINGGVRGEEEAARVKKVIKLIKEYKVDMLWWLENQTRDEIRLSSKGDCWYCLMRTDENKTLGEVIGNNDHLMGHLEEKYFMFSLTYRAIEAAGYNNPQFMWQHGPAESLVRATVRYFKRGLSIAS